MQKVEEVLKCKLRVDTPTAVYLYSLVFLWLFSSYVSPLLSALFLWGLIFFYVVILQKGKLSYEWFYEVNKIENKRELIVLSAVLYFLLVLSPVPVVLFFLTKSSLFSLFFAVFYYYGFFGWAVPEFLKRKTLKNRAVVYLKYLGGVFVLDNPLLYVAVSGVIAFLFLLSPIVSSVFSSFVFFYLIACSHKERGGV